MKDLASLGKLGFSEKDTKSRFNDVLGNLSIFAPLSHEQVHNEDDPLRHFDMERPVTPIDDEVKRPPATFRKLAKLVRRRISARPEITHVSIDDQKELAAVIMGEVNSIWKDIRLQVDDPLLTTEQNVELQRRITVYMVTVCEQLFLLSIQKLEVLNRRGVFSTPANMSRLKAMLSLDANKFLNVLTIRRYIIEDIKYRKESSDHRMQIEPLTPLTNLNYKLFLEMSRPKKKEPTVDIPIVNKEIAKLTEMLPSLDPGKLAAVLEDMPKERKASEMTEETEAGVKSKDEPKQFIFLETERTKSEIMTRKNVLLKRSNSLPKIVQAPTETLLDELGVDLVMEEKLRPKSALALAKECPEEDQIAMPSARDTPGLQLGAHDVVAKDLRNLMRRHALLEKEHEDKDPEEIPALIQALTTSVQHDKRVAEVQDQLLMLEENERKQREAETLLLQEPEHPQPAVLTNKLGNGLVVRTSDVRVSERVCLGSITLQKHSALYNEFLNEVDSNYLKNLDDNLFFHNEISEVYKEIMKTVTADHLDMDNDPHVQPATYDLNLSEAMASATLSRAPRERVINPKLRQDETECPWGEELYREWLKTPSDPPLDFRGRPTIQKMVPKTKLDEFADLVGDDAAASIKKKMLKKADKSEPELGRGEDGGEEEGGQSKNALEEFTARNYASWEAWWKETITSDDYLKYVALQGSDFLGVCYHFYNSDDEDDDDFGTSEEKLRKRMSKMKKQMAIEKQRRLEEMRKQKNEYVHGFWNVMAVAMGGLGKDPELEEAMEHGLQQIPSDVLKRGLQGQPSGAVPVPATTHPNPAGGLSVDTKSSKPQFTTGKPAEAQQSGQNISQHNKARSPRRRSPTKHSFSPRRYADSRNKNMSNLDSDEMMSPDSNRPKITFQERLEDVWNTLEMPDNMCLEMAIKYSTEKFFNNLPEALALWEQVAGLIGTREAIMMELEKFESKASDPNRFFEKGKGGSSMIRLQESKRRSAFYKKIEELDHPISEISKHILKKYGDVVTFRTRPYMEKMQHDRTEMLHWLQEERRQQAINYEAKNRHLPPLPMFSVDIDPKDFELPGTSAATHEPQHSKTSLKSGEKLSDFETVSKETMNEIITKTPIRPQAGPKLPSQPLGKGMVWRGSIKPENLELRGPSKSALTSTTLSTKQSAASLYRNTEKLRK